MARYIDADKLIAFLDETVDDKEMLVNQYNADWIYSFIENAPTSEDAKPVVRGEWISEIVKKCDWKGKKHDYYQGVSCSICHEPNSIKSNYCPNCGAYMRGENNDL